MRILVPIVAATLLASCAKSPPPKPVAATPAPTPGPTPIPQPPAGAAANLTLPAQRADGSYATPNRDLSSAATIWHVRVAFNVAALGCDDAGHRVSAAYNRVLKAQKKTFAQAHRALASEYGGAPAFDAAMTRLYNYFAQPPAQPGFCATARLLLDEAAAAMPAQFGAFAHKALPRLDKPFADFYAAYDGWRGDVSLWRAGRWTPRLRYDSAVFVTDDQVTDGAAPRVVAR